MTTTSVKDVSTVMSTMAANVGNAAGVAAETSFQSVWNNQTNRNQASEEPEKRVSANGNTDPRDEVLKANETVRKPVKETVKHAEKENGLSEEQTEEAMEVLGSVANEMMQQVADTFGMSVEELKQLMDDMGMDMLDIMNPEQLSALLLNAAGVEDTMALLTNGELYADFKQLMSKQQELLNAAGNELGLSPEQLTQIMSEVEDAQQPVYAVTEDVLPEQTMEPVVEITVETDDADDNVLTNQKNETVKIASGQNAESVETLATQGAGSKAQAESDGEQSLENHNEQTPNPFLQNLKNQAIQPEVNSVQTTSTWDADTQEIMRQIMDYLRIQIKPDMSDMEMQLHPESLGRLQIHVSSKGGVLTANFVTQNETVKAALESQMIQLKESFAEQGMKVESIEVTVQTHQFERELNQGRGSSNQGENEKKGRTRRINLNAMEGLEDREEMTGEEVLAAEIMTANGNTVDYTA